MGWSFDSVDYGRESFIKERTRYSESEKSIWDCVAFSDKGNHLWKVIKYTDKTKNETNTFIALDLIAKERNGGWGYKDMSEHAGPCHYDCPLKFLKMSDEPNEDEKYAVEWRKKVRDKPKVIKKEIGKLYKLIPTANIYGRDNLTVEILSKLSTQTYLCKAMAENGDIVSYGVRVTSSCFAK
jgi:hypothetical protein